MKIYFTFLLALISAVVFCQTGGVSISPNSGSPDPSAAVDIQYTNKGFLMPRLTSAQITVIGTPATGLVVFNTDSAAYYYYNGSIWTNLSHTGNNPGDMLYWNGANWVIVPAGTSGQLLTFANGAPGWAATLPTVLSTTAASAITANTASGGGDISNGGLAPVTAYGVCWDTSPNPVLGAGNFTDDGTGTGTFTSSITGLTASTTYYVRAYATNVFGTAYGPQITFTTLLGVGAPYGGGIVAYILQPADAGYDPNTTHGLIAATSDQSTGIAWYNGSNVTTGATGTAIGTGASNTARIITVQGPGTYAATKCTAYTGGGYNDWYLPSIDELNELYLNQTTIGNFNNGNGYQSSTEYDVSDSWLEGFSNGAEFSYTKSNPWNVRCIRAF